MTSTWLPSALVALCLLFGPVSSALADANERMPNRAEYTKPLSSGADAPDAELRTIDGVPVKLSTYYGDRPLALIFYRGGW